MNTEIDGQPAANPVTATFIAGDCRTALAQMVPGFADCAIVDPPYGDTSLAWDRRDDSWIPHVAAALRPAASLWVFGSLRYVAPLFAKLALAGFQYSQDIVWEKQNGTGFHADRFRRVHEHAVLFYRGAWRDVFHETQYTMDATARAVRRKKRPTHTGNIEAGHYISHDGGPRMRRSVLKIRNEHGRAIHPTQKPVELVELLVRYSCPPGGTVVDPFAGSCTTAIAARNAGRASVMVEIDADMLTSGYQRFHAPEAAR